MAYGLLVVTQVMDERDPVLGFFVHWVRGLAAEGELLHVVCWQADPALSIPGVTIQVLPKGALWRTLALMYLSWKQRKAMRGVFVHMIPPVVVALGWWWRLLGWRVVLWYTHGTVSWSLRLAEWFTHVILTASEESCRLRTKKKRVVGHGIDLDFFRVDPLVLREEIVLTVGRVTPRKDLATIIDICAMVRARLPECSFRLLVVGEPRTPDDYLYAQSMQAHARASGVADMIEWVGVRTGNELRTLYQRASVFLSASQTGSLDKVVLEALACGTPVVAMGRVYADVAGVSCAENKERAVEMVLESLRHPASTQAGRAWVEENADIKGLLANIRSAIALSSV